MQVWKCFKRLGMKPCGPRVPRMHNLCSSYRKKNSSRIWSISDFWTRDFQPPLGGDIQFSLYGKNGMPRRKRYRANYEVLWVYSLGGLGGDVFPWWGTEPICEDRDTRGSVNVHSGREETTYLTEKPGWHSVHNVQCRKCAQGSWGCRWATDAFLCHTWSPGLNLQHWKNIFCLL